MNIRLVLLTKAVACLLPSLLSAQTVTTQPLSATSYCVGQIVSVDFTVTGSFVSGNAMILQMSNPEGSFTTGFRNMKSISTTTSGTIEATVPGDIPTSTRYRFRVIASNPEVNGSDNGTDIALYMAPQIKAGMNSGGVIMRGRYYAFTGMSLQMGNSTAGASSYWWNFGIGVGATPEQTPDAAPSVTYSTPGEKPIRFLAYTPNGCEWFRDMKAMIMTYDAVLPSNVIIVRGDTTMESRGGKYICVCPGGICRLWSGEGDPTIYVEKGGSVVTRDLHEAILYLKEGASVTGVEYCTGMNILIHEEGASFPVLESHGTQGVWDIQVPTLTFDYSNVPPGGCPSLAPYTVQIKQSTNGIHTSQNHDKSDVEYWVRNGGALSSTGSGNAFYVEAGGHVTVNGSNGRIYLKDGATLDVQSGSNNRIFYESQATIVNAGTDAILLPSSGITFVNEVSSVRDDVTAGGNLVTISPNPVRDQTELHVDPMLGRAKQIVLYDVAGRELERRQTNESLIRLSLDGYASGRYFVEVETEKGVYTRVLVKE